VVVESQVETPCVVTVMSACAAAGVRLAPIGYQPVRRTAWPSVTTACLRFGVIRYPRSTDTRRRRGRCADLCGDSSTAQRWSTRSTKHAKRSATCESRRRIAERLNGVADIVVVPSTSWPSRVLPMAQTVPLVLTCWSLFTPEYISDLDVTY
jgi:hypothetical protein